MSTGFEDFHNMLDDFFTNSWPLRRSLAGDTFKIDVQDNEKEYVVEAELPGIQKNDVNVSLEEGRLSISVNKQEVKEEQKPKKDEYIIENIVKALEENINCLIKVKNKFHYLGYFEDERAIGIKIEYLKLQNNTLKKYIPIKNDKDNAN